MSVKTAPTFGLSPKPAPACSSNTIIVIRTGISRAAGNTWHVCIYPGKVFTCRLTREGREYRVDFDLSTPVPPPPLPWGHGE